MDLLRQELGLLITTSLTDESYARRLGEVADWCKNSISIVKTEQHKGTFNCHAFALNLFSTVEYQQQCQELQNSAFIHSGVMTELIENGILSEVRKSQADAGDIVVYYKNEKPAHSGRLTGPGLRITSKCF